MRVNLGSGRDYREGWVNVDNLSECPGTKIDKNHDLDRFPYPFKSDSVDEIYCNHVLEHIKEPDKALREMCRIVKPGGVLRLNVPHFSRGYAVHVHWHGFSIWSVLEDMRGLFEPVEVRLVWGDPHSFRRFHFILKPFCIFWNAVLNKNHWFAERFLAYKFGGIEEIRFVLRKTAKAK